MKARRAHLFPDITHTLPSISMLCNQDYMAIFDDEKVYIIKEGEVIICGDRDKSTNLYMVNISLNIKYIEPKLNIKHMENLGATGHSTNNAYERKIKKHWYHIITNFASVQWSRRE